MEESKKLTNEAGAPVAENEHSLTTGVRGPVALQDVWLLEKLAHFDREVIPERRMQTQQGIKNLTDEEAELDLSGALYAYDPQDDPTDNCFRAGGDLWRVMTEDKRALLIENTARNIEPVSDNIKYRHAVHCYWADEAYGRRITEAMGLDMAKVEESRYKVSNTKSVSKTLAILSTFDETAPMQRTSDIAMKLDMNVSTVSRHLNTMLDWGFLERDDFTGFYYPGLEIVALAGAALQNNDAFHLRRNRG